MGTEGLITLGIGGAPGNLIWFMALGLVGGAAASYTGIVHLTAPGRDFSLTATGRDFSLTVGDG